MITEPNRDSKVVLAVDDDLSVLQLIDWILSDAGFEVKCAESGFAALKKFPDTDWGAVIVDRGMPGMNGEELARTIKESSPGMPLIMISGLIDAIAVPQLFDAILAKPFRSAQLVDCLALVLSRQSGRCATLGLGD